jgi:hypothetical protein
MLMSADVLAALATCRDPRVDVNEEPLPRGKLVWWSGAPLAGVPTPFRVRDPDGNSFRVVASP